LREWNNPRALAFPHEWTIINIQFHLLINWMTKEMTNTIFTHIKLVLIASAVLIAGPALADKPSWAGGGQHGKHKQKEDRHDDRNERYGKDSDRDYHNRERTEFDGGGFFIDRHRTVVRDYYYKEYRSGHCPPGLAKKRNGCLPPGQAKAWTIGRPLPRDVVFYDLPPTVITGMGPPPPGYRYVRVASDILLIAVGTSMVMDAIQDLGGW
jgi:Ni/Co efflux regulator RcnB